MRLGLIMTHDKKSLTHDADLCGDGHGCGDTQGAVQVGEEVLLEEGQGGEEAPEGQADHQAGGHRDRGQVGGGHGGHVHRERGLVDTLG